jgi:uncharacterized membrane protein YdjX (TVP38/TMEM64 family)
LTFCFGSPDRDFRQAADAAIRREMRRRWLTVVLVCLGLVVGGWYVGRELTDAATFDMQAAAADHAFAFVMAAVAVFVVASATPFVPGAEIGFGLILIFGAKVALIGYAAMVAALSVSFLAGRLLPPSLLASLFGYLGLGKARDLTLALAPLDPESRLRLLTEKLPHRLVPMLLRHRYLALIALLNLPGNSVVGGGGGIAFTAGLSGLFSLPAYLGTVLVAVAPVPAFVLATGYLA